MPSVIITGWRSGLHKIRMTKLIREYTDLGLKVSKNCTDRVLDGETVTVAVETDDHATQLAVRLQQIGAVTEAYSS